jgi:glycosyltransferase involved in cell wall biosynthesis
MARAREAVRPVENDARPPLRVLLVSGSYPPMRCGVGDYTERLAVALRGQPGVEVQVVTSTESGAAAGDQPWVRPAMPSWRLVALADFATVLGQFRPDIVHIQYPTQGYRVASGPVAIPFVARLRGAAVVVTWHEYPPQKFSREMMAMCIMAAAAQAVVYVRPDYGDRIRGALAHALGDAPLRFIPNASVIPAVTLSEADRRNVRAALGCNEEKLVAFFGFAYPHKGVHLLFEIADPKKHRLLLISELAEADEYHRTVQRLASSERWRGRVVVTGFAPPEDVARLLAAADAAVFPFAGGGGMWNSSLHAATSQGTFTIATSVAQRGYFEEQNTYYAEPGAVDEMRTALERHAGRRMPSGGNAALAWRDIAREHAALYRALRAGMIRP